MRQFLSARSMQQSTHQSQRSTMSTPDVNSRKSFEDNRIETLTQRKLKDIIHSSSQMNAQRKLALFFHNGSSTAVQKKALQEKTEVRDSNSRSIAQNIKGQYKLEFPVVQRRTSVEYEGQGLEYQDSTGNPQKDTVGYKMTALLDPKDPIQGSEPGSGAAYGVYESLNYYWGHADNFIKGHLLNAHLGGLGVPDNLFPITSSANARHKEWEYGAKEVLYGQISNAKKALPYHHVLYEVKAIEESAKKYFDDNPKAKFVLSLSLADGNGAVQKQIWNNIEIVSEMNKQNTPKGINKLLSNEGWGASGSGNRFGVSKVDDNKIKNDPNFKQWYKNGIDGGYVEGNRVLAVTS